MRIDRATQTLGHITLFPDNHDQRSWCSVPISDGKVSAAELKENPSSCGTTLCFAGTATALFAPRNAVFVTGDHDFVYLPDVYGDYIESRYSNGLSYEPVNASYHDSFDLRTRFRRETIREFACNALSLEHDQADWLFEGTRTKEELFSGVRYLMSHPRADRYDLHSNCAGTNRY